MIHYTMEIPVVTPGKADYTATLEAFVPTNGLDLPINKQKPAVIIFPGGGYSITYDGEAEPIALHFTSAGVAAFIVRYSCAPAVFPQALCEGLWVVGYVRDHAKEYGIDPTNIATLGFSAGGHLCGCTGTLWNQDFLKEYLSGELSHYRPDKMVLCYPVLQNHDVHHHGSFENLLGEKVNDPEMLKLTSLDLHVDDNTPPSFFWMTFEDDFALPNALPFITNMTKHGRPVEVHVYPHGAHGLCTADYVTRPECAFMEKLAPNEWMNEAVRFLFDKDLGV